MGILMRILWSTYFDEDIVKLVGTLVNRPKLINNTEEKQMEIKPEWKQCYESG